MKNTLFKYFIALCLSFFVIACSVRRDTFLSRNSHALSTKYNILYNGGVALDKGIVEVINKNKDNFWEILPIERMQISDVNNASTEAKNANFDRAETKATKAIQKHSMNIQGTERNPQMDEAYLLLGKSRYYDQRFLPALEAFNYVLYKYPKSDKIYEVKIWREKTNMRLDNDAVAINNLRKLLREIKFKDQIFADANAALAQAYLNTEEKDSAVGKLRIAIQHTKYNEEKSRYRYIIGQIFEKLGQKDSAFAAYLSVIDMHRKAGRQYVINAHARQASQFDYKSGDTLAFLKKFNDLIADRENRPYLDVLHHQMALFYEKRGFREDAKKHYMLSIKKRTDDTYMIASNYRNLADIHFIESKFVTAGKYYDSTLVRLKPRTREYNFIKKKRENLEDVIKYEGISRKNDSIISLYNMPTEEKLAYFQKFIDKLKKEDKADLKLADAKKANAKEKQAQSNAKKDGKTDDPNSSVNDIASSNGSDFYFYNPATVAFGKLEFEKNWGKRTLKDNWRISSLTEKNNDNKEEVTNEEQVAAETNKEEKDTVKVEEKYTTAFYINKLPTAQTTIDSLSKERNFAFYQLGVLYKEKFKEFDLAINRFERLLNNQPEERLVLPSMYNLYKLYETIMNKQKAEAMKARIIAEYPNSRYAQILLNPESATADDDDSPNGVYQKVYKQYQKGEFKEVLASTENAINRFNGEDVVPKFELLKAKLMGKLYGLEEYKKALNFVALNYPNKEEGKKAEQIFTVEVPKLEALQLSKKDSKNWKILYQSKNLEDDATKQLLEKLKKFIADRSLDKLTISQDIYTMTDNFIVIHGMKSQDLAKNIASVLKEYKDYKVEEKPIVITDENYTIVQIKKNLEDYLAGKLEANPTQPNWDGSYEKPVVVEQKPKEAPKQEQQEEIKQGKQSTIEGGFKQQSKGQEKEPGLPPAPQFGGGAEKKG